MDGQPVGCPGWVPVPAYWVSRLLWVHRQVVCVCIAEHGALQAGAGFSHRLRPGVAHRAYVRREGLGLLWAGEDGPIAGGRAGQAG